MKAVKLKISGRVQGVGFRYHTFRKAIELHINGYVRNETDGSVFVAAEGEEPQLNEFVAWCHSGPRWASVEEVITYHTEIQHFPDFSIR